MRRNHPSANGVLTLDEFLELPFVVGSGAIAGTANFDRALEQKGLRRRIAVTTPSWPEVIPMILGSDLCAVLPEPWVSFYIDPDHLALRRLPPAIDMAFTAEAVWHESDDRDPGHRWLRRLIEEEFKGAHSDLHNRFRVTSVLAA